MLSSLKIFQLISEWITTLWTGLPTKLRPTLLELLLGAIISNSGHITDAILAIKPVRTWTTYFKVIENGKFSWLILARNWAKLLIRLLGKDIILSIDDFITLRASKKAPAVALHHDHAKRPNRPKFLWGQLRVTLAMIGSKNKRYAAFPLLMKLIPKNGNYSKLKAAKFLMKLFISYTDASFNIKLLLDAWYMKANLLRPLIKNNVTVIGQVRRDTALYLQPAATKKVGRPRKYGRKLTFEQVKQLFTLQEDTIVAYGKERKFQFYSLEAKARFLKGHLCKIVWCRLQQDTGKWTNWHLLLSTDPTLSGSTIIHLYSLRWWTESMFNEIKNLFGLQHAWQQTKQALARWSFILSLAYSIPKLLSLVLEPGEAKSFFSIPWRTEQPITAGWIATGIRFYFQNFKVRCLWDRKSQKMIIKKQHLDSIYGKIA